jgi:hypothetical protein
MAITPEIQKQLLKPTARALGESGLPTFYLGAVQLIGKAGARGLVDFNEICTFHHV